MYDLEQIRRRCRELPIDELVREAVLEANDYLPEPLQVMREELERRVGDIKGYIAQERDAEGDEIGRVAIKNFGRGTERYVGSLVLTDKGVGFVATERDREGLPSPFVHGVLPGLILSWVEGASAPRTDAGAAHASLPLPLLARIFAERVFWFPLASVGAIELDGEAMTIRPTDDAEAWGLVDASGWAIVEAWGQRTGARVAAKIHTSVWARLSRWLGR